MIRHDAVQRCRVEQRRRQRSRKALDRLRRLRLLRRVNVFITCSAGYRSSTHRHQVELNTGTLMPLTLRDQGFPPKYISHIPVALAEQTNGVLQRYHLITLVGIELQPSAEV
jgi:hypothetical protein